MKIDKSVFDDNLFDPPFSLSKLINPHDGRSLQNVILGNCELRNRKMIKSDKSDFDDQVRDPSPIRRAADLNWAQINTMADFKKKTISSIANLEIFKPAK